MPMPAGGSRTSALPVMCSSGGFSHAVCNQSDRNMCCSGIDIYISLITHTCCRFLLGMLCLISGIRRCGRAVHPCLPSSIMAERIPQCVTDETTDLAADQGPVYTVKRWLRCCLCSSTCRTSFLPGQLAAQQSVLWSVVVSCCSDWIV